jgi:hypothetical protein
VGSTVGSGVGSTVGSTVGSGVGSTVGRAGRVRDGSGVGSTVGVGVGRVGSVRDGVGVGSAVGRSEGIAVGIVIGGSVVGNPGGTVIVPSHPASSTVDATIVTMAARRRMPRRWRTGCGVMALFPPRGRGAHD